MQFVEFVSLELYSIPRRGLPPGAAAGAGYLVKTKDTTEGPSKEAVEVVTIGWDG